MSIVHSSDKDRLVLKVGNAFDIFTVEGDRIVMLRTAPAASKDKAEREKSLEAVFSPEWIHEIDLWYREYQTQVNLEGERIAGNSNGDSGTSG